MYTIPSINFSVNTNFLAICNISNRKCILFADMQFFMYYVNSSFGMGVGSKMSIGNRIKMMRTKQGLSIDELACKLNKNRTTIYRYESGNIENLPLGILDPLAEALNTTPAYLMGWEESTHGHSPTDKELYNLSLWHQEFEVDAFNQEERYKIIEYARFLLSIRDR